MGKITVVFLKEHPTGVHCPTLIDIGCGYGRDALYFCREEIDIILGIDSSFQAIEQGRSIVKKENFDRIEFRCSHFRDIDTEWFDIVYLSNLYQILSPNERAELRSIIQSILKPGGILFLSTLSIGDLQHSGKGIAVRGEQNSFIEPNGNGYLHFCTKEELLNDFSFLDVIQLYPLDYQEQRVGGSHNHISWVLIASNL